MSDESGKLAPVPATPKKGRPRVVTREVAEAIAAKLLEDVTQTIETASAHAGVKSSTVRNLLARYTADKCESDEDEEIAEIIYAAKIEHLRRMRGMGFQAAGNANNPGVSWMKWQLEIQDPLNHPRKTETAVELSGPGGGPVKSETETTVRYVVAIPPTEPEHDPDPEDT